MSRLPTSTTNMTGFLATSRGSLFISIKPELSHLEAPYCHFTTLGLTCYVLITVVAAAPPCVVIPPPGVGSHLGRIVRSGVRALLGRSPTGLAESSSLVLRTVLSSLVALHLSC